MDNNQERALLDSIKSDALLNRTPSYAMESDRPDAKAMLHKFYSQHPFVPITPIMSPRMVILNANAPFEFTFPNGTIMVVISAQLEAPGVVYGSWDGIATPIASLATATQLNGYFPITPGGRSYFLYGKRQVQVVSSVVACAFVECYLGEDGLIG